MSTGALGGVVALAVILCFLGSACIWHRHRRLRHSDADTAKAEAPVVHDVREVNITGRAQRRSSKAEYCGDSTGGGEGSHVDSRSEWDQIPQADDAPIAVLPQISWARFSPDSLLGAGPMGRVYKGKCHGVNVAVRRISPQARALYGTGEELLRQEVQVLWRLSHPHLLRVAALIAEAVPAASTASNLGGSGIMMELMQSSLADRIAALGATPMTEAEPALSFSIARQIALGLAYLHGQGVLHGSLSPSNIMLGGGNTGKHAKLTDYGRNRRVALGLLEHREAELASRGISPGDSDSWCGPFVAPELFSVNGWNPPADVYSFGAIVARMGSRAPLYSEALSREPWHAVRQRIAAFELRPIQETTDRAVVDLASRCVAADPVARPSAALLTKDTARMCQQAALAVLETTNPWQLVSTKVVVPTRLPPPTPPIGESWASREHALNPAAPPPPLPTPPPGKEGKASRREITRTGTKTGSRAEGRTRRTKKSRGPPRAHAPDEVLVVPPMPDPMALRAGRVRI